MNEFEKYKSEVAQKWDGTDAYKEYEEKTENYTNDKWSRAAQGLDDLMAEFALCMKNGVNPNSAEAQNLVKP